MNKILFSDIDKSINILSPYVDGIVESRFVQRYDDYFIIYLSSHNGCNQSCRFCFLSQHGDTKMVDVNMENYILQFNSVVEQINKSKLVKATKCHMNFMARGEPLLNHTLVNNSYELFDKLKKTLYDSNLNLETKFNVSSIIPSTFYGNLENIFEHPDSTLYYSLYSVDDKFRKKWLPKAMNPFKALDMIKSMQEKNGKEVVIHNCFIKSQNDSDESIMHMFDALLARDIKFRFNLVRYNTFDASKFQETDENTLNKIVEYANMITHRNDNKMVSRVGFDVAASCGMFIK